MASRRAESGAAITIQKAWRLYCKTRDAKKLGKRHLLVQEIANLERLYVSNIAYICVLYEQPMREKARVSGPITDNLLDSIFLNLADIVKCHTAFSSVLLQRERDWNDGKTIGDCFVEFSKRFDPIYSKYILGFPAAMEKLEESMQNNSVLRGMVQIQYDADPNMKTLALEDLLMMPVQRMPRYELLLASLLKTTPRNHADYALLKSAHRLIQGLCASFNANKSEAERRYRETRFLTELNTYIPRDPRRALVFEGDVVELCRTSKRGTNTRKQRRMFLFNDIVVCAKPIRNTKNAEMLGDYTYKPRWMVTLPKTRAEAKQAFDTDVIARATLALGKLGSTSSSGMSAESPKPRRGHLRSRSEDVKLTFAANANATCAPTTSATSLTDVSQTSSAVPSIRLQTASNEGMDDVGCLPPPRPNAPPPRTPTNLQGNDQAGGKRRKSSAFDLDSMFKSLSLRRTTTKGNMQDGTDPTSTGSAPSLGSVYGGDDIHLLITSVLGMDREEAFVLCQELLDRRIMQHVASQQDGEFRASSTHMYRVCPLSESVIAEPTARISQEIEILAKEIQLERTQLASVMNTNSNGINKGKRSGWKKQKDSTSKSLEEKQKTLAALKEKLELHRHNVPFELLSCVDGFHMFSFTLYTCDKASRDIWVDHVNTRCEISKEAIGSEGHYPEGVFKFVMRGSKRSAVRVTGSNTKPKNTLSTSTEVLFNTSHVSLQSVGSRGSVSDQKSMNHEDRSNKSSQTIVLM